MQGLSPKPANSASAHSILGFLAYGDDVRATASTSHRLAPYPAPRPDDAGLSHKIFYAELAPFFLYCKIDFYDTLIPRAAENSAEFSRSNGITDGAQEGSRRVRRARELPLRRETFRST